MKGSSKSEYVIHVRAKYQVSDRVLRTQIINELVRNLNCHRKSAIRLMKPQRAAKSPRGRKCIYSETTIHHLRKLWRLMDFPAARRLKEALPLWLKKYDCEQEIKESLLKMSPATIDRWLEPVRSRLRRWSNTGTRSITRVKTQIPLKSFSEKPLVPGYVEADTVAHCGGSLEGLFGWSLTVTDIVSGYTENRSMWGKSAFGVVQAMTDIEKQLPFSLKVTWVDNGNEFLNHQLLYYFKSRESPVRLERGRPYRKNDQSHVEQKNFTHVRQLFGYDRIDESKELIEVMNDIYRNEWSLLQNYFMPQMKLVEKVRVGAKIKRKHSKPMTPVQRLLESPEISNHTKNQLRLKLESLDPFKLRESLQRKLKRFYQIKETTEKQKKVA